ncbi:MAG: ABC transporter substrate-binding protein [Bacteroidales bacterium]|nr:ABC transporter substrate-binding protein [Bacteroidales bacterium]
MRSLTILFLLPILLSGCNRVTGKHGEISDLDTNQAANVRYATGFKTEDKDGYQIITVFNPWQKAENIAFRYYLTGRDTVSSLPDGANIIKIPVKKVVCLSTTHLGFLEFINETDALAGISGTRYVTNTAITERIEKGEVRDIGYDEQINYELIVKLQPDLVIAYAVSGNEASYLGKLRELGIQVMYVAEYLEENPVAKMEWVKVFAALFDKTGETTVRFDSVAANYHSLTLKAKRIDHKPKVLSGLPWNGTWYISGGESYFAKLIADAGGSYLWKNTTFKDSRPMSLESVYARAIEADFWLNTGTANTIKEVTDVDSRFENLPALKKKNIFNYNRLSRSDGGNAYFETGVVEPDIILKDLITILHPEVLPSHQLKYYKKLE